jgi:hypothetical protein
MQTRPAGGPTLPRGGPTISEVTRRDREPKEIRNAAPSRTPFVLLRAKKRMRLPFYRVERLLSVGVQRGAGGIRRAAADDG